MRNTFKRLLVFQILLMVLEIFLIIITDAIYWRLLDAFILGVLLDSSVHTLLELRHLKERYFFDPDFISLQKALEEYKKIEMK